MRTISIMAKNWPTRPNPATRHPAYESKIAYDVEVTKADGSVVDVHLDKAFKVLGTEKADAEQVH